MTARKFLGTITILTTDRHLNTADLQKILTKHGDIIMARLGVNVQPSCVAHCTGLISLAVKGTKGEMTELVAKINKLKGIKAKLVIMA